MVLIQPKWYGLMDTRTSPFRCSSGSMAGGCIPDLLPTPNTISLVLSRLLLRAISHLSQYR